MSSNNIFKPPSLIQWFFQSVILCVSLSLLLWGRDQPFCENIFMALSHPVIKLTVEGIFRYSSSWMASKLHYWFKSYYNFAEKVDFVHRWRCIGKGVLLQPARKACFFVCYFYITQITMRFLFKNKRRRKVRHQHI